MARKRKGCIYCNSNLDNWDYQTIPVDAGDFGDYEIDIYVSGGRKVIGIDFSEVHHDPIISTSLNINYCPFCGTRLREVDHENG